MIVRLGFVVVDAVCLDLAAPRAELVEDANVPISGSQWRFERRSESQQDKYRMTSDRVNMMLERLADLYGRLSKCNRDRCPSASSLKAVGIRSFRKGAVLNLFLPSVSFVYLSSCTLSYNS